MRIRPWLATEESLQQLAEEVKRWASHPTQPTAEQINTLRESMRCSVRIYEDEESPPLQVRGGAEIRSIAKANAIAVLPVRGMIEQHPSWMSYWGGGFATSVGEELITQLLNEPVAAIVLDIDSPGGTSYGVEEFASFIRKASKKKPIHAIANSVAGSAAYWIGSSCSTLTVSPGGEVGSIGAFLVHEDFSSRLEQEGIKITMIRAGKFKAEAMPFAQLTDEAIAHLQSQVDSIYGSFCRGVATSRGVETETVRSGFGQGRMVLAQKAVELGMADQAVPFNELLRQLSKGKKIPTTKRTESLDEGTRVAAQQQLRHSQTSVLRLTTPKTCA